jgi:hypothetical protein
MLFISVLFFILTALLRLSLTFISKNFAKIYSHIKSSVSLNRGAAFFILNLIKGDKNNASN